MTNEETALREVDQAIAEDRQKDLFKRYGALMIGGAALAVAAVAGYQVWRARAADQAQAAALEYKTATEVLAKTPEDGRVALAALSETAPKGYALIADFARAASLADSGDREGALAALRNIYDRGDAPKRLRELARLRAAALASADGRDAVLQVLGSLAEETTAMGYYARELSAAAALAAKDYETALSMFRKAADDVAAPQPVRERAKEFAALATAGKAGVNLTGEARVDDLAEALDALSPVAPEPAPAETPPPPEQPPAPQPKGQ